MKTCFCVRGPCARALQAKKAEEEEFYTEGNAALQEARMFLLEYSIPRARDRLERERVDARRPIAMVLQRRKEIEAKAKVRLHTLICAHSAIEHLR